MIKKNFQMLMITLAICTMCSCNASIEKVASSTNKVKDEYRTPLQTRLETVYTPFKIPSKWGKDGTNLHTTSTMSKFHSKASDFLNREMTANLFPQGPDNSFSGYVTCKLLSNKEKLRCWGIPINVVTSLVFPIFGHTNFERIYEFEIHDAFGEKIASYKVKGSKNNIMNYYSSNNYDGSELAAFKNALQKFEKEVAKDALKINRKLRISSDRLHGIRTKNLTQKDIQLSTWLNSEELLSLTEIDRMLDEAPDDYMGWGLKIEHCLRNGQYTAALSCIERYCELNPTCDVVMPYFKKAYILNLFGRKDDALEALTLAMGYHPREERIYTLYATIMGDYGAFENAHAYIKMASELNPDNLETRNTLATVEKILVDLKEQNNKEKIDEHMRRMAAISMASSAMANTASGIGTIVSTHKQSNQPVAVSKNISDKSANNKKNAKEQKCSFCHGTGKNPAKERPPFYSYSEETYSNSPCEVCGDRDNHYHKPCPSCQGKGTVIRAF